MLSLKKILKSFSLFGLVLLIVGGLYYLFDSTKPFYTGPFNEHFDGKKFHNYNPQEGVFSLSDVGKWQFYEFKDDVKRLWPDFLDDVNYDSSSIEKLVGLQQIKITFINHATFLIQTDNFNILTDPIFSERASPVEWAGPKRYRNPGIPLEELPKIDFITISHDHYDHCDVNAIKYLQDKFDTKVIGGLGVKEFLKHRGINSIDLDWWQDLNITAYFSITFVPAIHWSGRYGFSGNNRTLWGGYVISSSGGKIYFSGDTAFGTGNEFRMIKQRFKNITFAILPIGAYEPRWFMKTHHINPEEAVKIHQILDPYKSIAAHFGCFALSTEGEGKPEEDLQSSLRKNNIPAEKFSVVKHGEFILK